MRFKSLDLNLLAAFDALMETRSVSRAAEQLNLSQPAMSAALAAGGAMTAIERMFPVRVRGGTMELRFKPGRAGDSFGGGDRLRGRLTKLTKAPRETGNRPQHDVADAVLLRGTW